MENIGKNLDFEKMLKAYRKNQSKLPQSVKIKGKIGIMKVVDEICQKEFNLHGMTFHFVNGANPIMKNTDDATLIKVCMIYGTFPERNFDYVKHMFDEIEDRGYKFVKRD